MNQPPSISLDHVGFILPDLVAARQLFADLGFTLTARADHTRKTADGRTVSAGSAQHSVMLDTGYIELMQITDPDAGHQLTPAIRVRHGLHVLALGTSDAAAWHARCAREGLATGALMDWSREVRTDERSGLARFRYFDSPWQPSDPSYICWVEHLTPDLVRSPALVRHANTATGLAGLAYAGPADGLAAWSQRLRASGAIAGTHPGVLDLHGQIVRLDTDDRLDVVRPSALLLEVQDLAAFERSARASGLPLRTDLAGCVKVDLPADHGLTLEARPAS